MMYEIPEHLKIFDWYPSHLAWLGYDVNVEPKQANLEGANLEGADLSGAYLDFSSGLPMWCGAFGVITDYQQECQQAYHTLRRLPDFSNMPDKQAAKLRKARAALVDLANDWDGIERHDLDKISE
jgi:hypothetical protein